MRLRRVRLSLAHAPDRQGKRFVGPSSDVPGRLTIPIRYSSVPRPTGGKGRGLSTRLSALLGNASADVDARLAAQLEWNVGSPQPLVVVGAGTLGRFILAGL